MATHFARGILTEGHLISVRLPSQCHQEARNIPPHRQSRFLASRGLLAELMFMLYGIGELPEIVTLNRPGFPGECFICELRLPDHRFRWKHNKLFLLL
ncbi:phosphopantetheinyl transferase, partial [Escherichia coli]|uniref:phosphopantetheinyl transferase n=1 Tax=Escherichia coli TaxID=562 RepID=UPI0020351B0A